MKYLKTLVLAVLAGVCIAIGGAANLALGGGIPGAVFFAVGLFTICTCGFCLFTGKVCYVFERDAAYALDLPIIWLGNLIGAWLTAQALSLTRMGETLSEAAQSVSQTKLSDGLLSVFILAIFCNILIYIAVDGFNNNLHELGKYLALFFGVTVFIICGFEHCVANMFYFSMAGVWSGKALLYMLVMTLGNAVGGVLLPLLRGWVRKPERCTEAANG